MDAFEQYVERNLLSRETVLKLIDDYSLFCFYLGIEMELGTRYSSPLREGDDNPSFVLFQGRTGEVLYKDYARMGSVGNVFKFIGELLGLDGTDTLLQINSDLGLGLEGKDTRKPRPVIAKKPMMVKEKVKIEITSRPRNSFMFQQFWASYGIEEEVLEMYNVKEVDVLHFVTPSQHTTIIPKPLCISYRIFDRYKIYQPFEKDFKFSNDFEEGFVEGAEQLEYKYDTCIITKATKEIMFIRQHFGLDSVAGKSETTMVSDYFLQTHIFPRYKHVLICLDQDTAGRKAQQMYVDKYPQLIPVNFDSNVGAKDLTDHYTMSEDKSMALRWIYNTLTNGRK
tara:strand:+ start:4779 stop:5795 length:1017 start_codon:yes stop_codon:yes gene_type:complete